MMYSNLGLNFRWTLPLTEGNLLREDKPQASLRVYTRIPFFVFSLKVKHLMIFGPTESSIFVRQIAQLFQQTILQIFRQIQTFFGKNKELLKINDQNLKNRKIDQI